MKLDSTQLDAVDLILHEPAGIITGGPGTGKTTILKEALAELPKSYEVICCAPTGKAAKRIMEVTGFPAGTVHRVLGAMKDGDRWRFRYNETEPLPFSVVFVDESSMLDAELASALLRAVNPDRTRIFFIGDANQLPSVGPGQVFADLIESNRIPVVRLTTVHRAAQKSWVCRNAPKILEGDIELEAADDFRFFRRLDPEKLLKQTVKLVTKTLPAAGVTDVQVLSPMNGGPIGVETFNNRIQFIVNPTSRAHDGTPSPSWTVRASGGTQYHLRAGDRVIATSNDYELMVFNGEAGVIQQISDRNKTMLVDFDGRVVEMTKEQARGLRLAYALTIHKSQGSEWDWVVVVCHSQHDRMWSRQLLYTAVTRAKKGVMLVGDNAGITIALRNDAPRHRYTSLIDRLTHDE